MKNTVYTVVIIACIILAIVIFFVTRSGGSGGLDSIKRGQELYWVKCNNPECKAEYQMDMKDYLEQVSKKMQANPLSMRTPGLTCEKCGKESVYKAYKCEKCGKVFFEGASGDYPDRCPYCKYSKTEADRKARLAERGR
jgi:predicted Zn-ribbon and HTH transcriptional regulator